MDIPQVLAVWLHTLALVIAWGYYGILGRVILPALERSLDGSAQAKALMAVERRAIPLVLLSVVMFTATGTYLLIINVHYAGVGNFFATTWTALMLVKHAFVIGFVALAVIVDLLVRRVGGARSEDARASALGRLALSAEAATGIGAVIVLLTAAAQVAA
jgi:uncharacterized membrane protein